jgi:beta-lactam-binding protein with PASTA domain
VGVEMVAVPAVTLHTFDEAQTIITGKHLSVGHVTSQANSNVAGGVVFQQSPDSGSVLTGAAIDLWVTPKTVQVPQVVNLLVGDALKKVQGAGLVMVLHGDQTTKLVTAQNPQYPAQVAVGSTVDVTVPSSSFCVPITRCRYTGNAVRLMVNKK